MNENRPLDERDVSTDAVKLPTFLPVPGRGVVGGAWAIFRLFFRRTLFSGRTLFASVLAILPLLLVGSMDVLFTVSDDEPTGAGMFDFIATLAYLQFLVPYLSLLFGSYAVGEEIEGRTAVFLITRPVPRAALALGKWMVAFAATFLVVGLSLVAFYGILGSKSAGGDLLDSTDPLLRYLCASAVAIFVYTALFTALGAWVRRGLLLGLLVTSVWEVVVANVPAPVQTGTIMYHARMILIHMGDTQTALKEILTDTEDLPTLGTTLLILGLVGLGGILLSAIAVVVREHTVER